MLRDDVEQYTNLTGEDGWHVPILKVGAYLDGYNKGLEVLNKIRAEIEQEYTRFRNGSDRWDERACGLGEALEIIDKYREEQANGEQ